jgi:hypothetical protein
VPRRPVQRSPADKYQLDVTDDGFLSLMSDDGSTKDDVKNPDGEVGDKINKMFTEDGKDTSKCTKAVRLSPN